MHSHYDIDGFWGVVMNVALVGIIMGYVMIAFQFWLARVGTTNPASRALTRLFAIFILCSLAGYAPRLMHFPQALLIGIHLALFGFTAAYALSCQAHVIAKALDRD